MKNNIVQKKILSIQVLRFIAVTLVLIAHSIDSTQTIQTNMPLIAFGYLENFGAIGVDIFFVISGFIIAQTGLIKETSPNVFLLHRIIRVIPIYYLLSIPWILLAIIQNHFSYSQLITTLLFWPAMPHHMSQPFLVVGWTLCFEMLFYFSIFVVKLKKLMWLLPLSVFIVSMLARKFTNYTIFQFIGNPIILEFFMGVIIAFNQKKIMCMPKFSSYFIFFIILLSISYLLIFGYERISESEYTIDSSLSFERFLLFGIPSAMLLIYFLTIENMLNNKIIKPLVILGDSSYSIYLIHPLILFIANYSVHKSGFYVEGNTWLLTLLILSTGCGYFIYSKIERPILIFLRNYCLK